MSKDSAKLETTNFRGIELYENQARVLEQIESLIDKKLTLLNEISYSQIGFTVNNKYIDGLSLFSVGLKQLPDAIGELQKLKIVFLNNNNLEMLPESIGRLRSLTRIELDNNKLKDLPKSFTELVNLSYLNLSFNDLSVFPESLCVLKKLLFLDLSKNLLTFIPETVLNLSKLNSLWLEGNDLNLKRPSDTRFFLETLSYNGVEIYL